MDSADYTDKFTQIIEQNRDENQYCYEQVTAKFDLNLTAVELGGKLHFNIEYCTRLFKAETIHRFIRYFKNLAALLSESENIEMKLADLDILTGKEKKEILEISTGIEQSYDREITQTVQRWFEEQVEKNPDAIAVIGHSAGCRPQGVNDRSTRCSLHHALTYRELNRRANQLAGFLRKKGVKPDTVVVIMMERSIEMIAAILSILKAGGAYIPIDAQYPDVRKQYMLEDSGPKLLLINYNIRHKQASVFIPNEIPVIDIRDEQIYHCDERNPEHIFAKSGSNLLYVIYTSGSTGKPKGVMMEHINLVNLIRYQIKYTNIDCSRVLQFTTISFDVSFQEIFSTLLGGGQLFLIDEETQRDIPLLFRFIENNQVKTLFLPASFLKFVLNEKEYQGLIPGCIDHIASAGEQLVVGNSLRKYLQQHQVFLHNHYGPAEAHVVTTLTLDPNDEIPVHPSIGRPISNCRIYILDNRHHLQPIGVSGQLVIGGIPVGRGYLNRPEITAEKFCLRRSGGRRMAHGAWCSALCALRASPRNSVPLQIPGKGIHSYMSSESYTYQTGDLGRWLSDGNIEFLGRLDTQVKIRGFRIELGEIENYLRNHADIKDAVVVAKEASNETREQYLCAYVVTNKESQVPELREYLSRNVPDYMIPSYFVPLEQIPLNPNRKVDKEALPEPDLRINANDTYAQPRDPVQKRMVNLWSEVLGIKTGVMGIDDNFFQLGGHSLKAAVLTSKLHKEFQVKVPLAEVFQNPTIRGLSKRIKRMKPGEYTSIPPGEEKEFYPASYNQKRLWLLNQESPQLSTFNMAGIITLDHDVDIHLVKKVLNRIIRRHDSFKTGFKVISDQLVQVIKKEMEIHFEMKDLSSITPPAKENKKQEIYSRELEAPFDLQQMPLFRAALLKLSEGKYELLFNMHHIISDGWSIEILKQEFKTLYDAYKKGIPCDIDMQPLEIQYKDYTVWQNQLLSDEEKMAEAKESWKAYLSGTLSVLNLPYDFTHYSNSTASSAYRCVVPESLTNQLRKMAAESHASLFMILLAGINILLSQVTGQEEIILAIPAAARQHEALKNILGFFVNTLILRSKINSEQPFMNFFKHFLDNTFKILDHQDIPMELIFSQLKIKYPIISVFFNMINLGATQQQTLTHFESHYMEKVQDAKFDIVFYISEYKNGIEINCHYLRNRFRPQSIEKLMDFYKKTLENICSEPGKKLKDYRFTTKKKKLKRHH